MLLFCPACSNMLTITNLPTTSSSSSSSTSDLDNPDQLPGQNRFECRTCPYQYELKRAYYERKTFPGKKAEDVLGGADAWKNVDRTEAACPNARCDGQEAFFRQAQTRSADEPMTMFLRCVTCGREWRE